VYFLELKLEEIGIKNFLSYKDAKFLDLKNFNVLIGKNSSGKSNLIKILVFLKERYGNATVPRNFLFDEINSKAEIFLRFSLSKKLREILFQKLHKGNYLQSAFNHNEGDEGFLKSGEWQKEEIAVKWLIDNGLYHHLDLYLSYIPELNRILITRILIYNKLFDKSQTFFSADFTNGNIKTEYLDFDRLSSNGASLLYFFSGYPSADIGFVQNKLNEIFINAKSFDKNPILQILLELLPKNFFNAIHHIPDKRKFDPDSSRDNLGKTKLDADGTNLVKNIHKKKVMNEDDWLNKFNSKLKSYMPEVDRLGDNLDNDSDLAILTLKEKGLEMELKRKNMGAGVLHIAHFIAYIMELEGESILCIEEPELFIYPGLQKLVRDSFIKNNSRNQIFITTHSPHFLSRDFNNSAIYKIEKANNSTLVKKISEENILEVFKELDLSLYDYLLYDGILFVEGQDDINVFRIVLEEIFEPTFKITQCYGKKNMPYYAEAEILDLLTKNDLNFLFLLDLDRGNENIWSKIKDNRLKKNLEEHTLKLFSYEIENIFLQPILIIDYLFTKNKIQNLVADSIWLFENLERIFIKKGENNLKYILKKFIDSNYDWFGGDDYEYIYNGSEDIRSLDDLYNYWIERIEELLNMKDQFSEVKIKEKTKLVDNFNDIKERYDEHYKKKEYFKIISGKEVIKELKVLLTNKFKLSETISVENLSIHILKFLNDYNYLLPKKGKKPDIFNFKDEFLAYEKQKIPITEEQLIDFLNYLEKLKKLIIGIQTKLNCKFQKNFERLNQMDFQQMFNFLIKRWNLNL